MPNISAEALQRAARGGRACPAALSTSSFASASRSWTALAAPSLAVSAPLGRPLSPACPPRLLSTTACAPLEHHVTCPDAAIDTPLLQSWFKAVNKNDIDALSHLFSSFQRETLTIRAAHPVSARPPLKEEQRSEPDNRLDSPHPHTSDPRVRRYVLAASDALNCVLTAIAKSNGSIAWDALLALHLAQLIERKTTLSPAVLEQLFRFLVKGSLENANDSLYLHHDSFRLLSSHPDLALNLSSWIDVATAFFFCGEIDQAHVIIDQAEARFRHSRGRRCSVYQEGHLLPLMVLRGTLQYQADEPTNQLTTYLANLNVASVPTQLLARAIQCMSLHMIQSGLADQFVAELNHRRDKTHKDHEMTQVLYRAARLKGDPKSRMDALWHALNPDGEMGTQKFLTDEMFGSFFHLATWDTLHNIKDYERAISLVEYAEKKLNRPAPHDVWELCVAGLLGQKRNTLWRSPQPEPEAAKSVLHGATALSPLRLVEAGLLLEHCASVCGPDFPAGGWALLLRAHTRSFVPDDDAITQVWDRMQQLYDGSLARQGGGGAYEALVTLARERKDLYAVTRVLHLAAEREDSISTSQLGPPSRLVELTQTEEELLELHRALMRLLICSPTVSSSHKWDEDYLTAVVERRFPLTGRRGRLFIGGLAVSGPALLEVCRDLRHIGRAPGGVQFVKLLNNVKRTSVRETDARRRDGTRDETAAQMIRAQAGEQVTALHTALQEDGTVEADVRLLNTLMNAYNFVGDAEAALGIWFSLLRERHAITPSTLSILFDLCGWTRLPQPAARAWDWARSVDEEMDQGQARSRPKRLSSPRRAPTMPAEPCNDPGHESGRIRPGQIGAPTDDAGSRAWMLADKARLVNDHVKLSYIEMLCRCHLYKAACELAWALVETGEMEGKRGVEREMWTLLLKFLARKRDRLSDPLPHRQLYDALRDRIRHERPHIWDLTLARVGSEHRPTISRNTNSFSSY